MTFSQLPYQSRNLVRRIYKFHRLGTKSCLPKPRAKSRALCSECISIMFDAQQQQQYQSPVMALLMARSRDTDTVF